MNSKPDQEDLLTALGLARAEAQKLRQALVAAGHAPKATIPAGADIKAVAGVWSALWKQAMAAKLENVLPLPFRLDEPDEDEDDLDEDDFVLAINAQTPAPAAAPAPKTAAAPAAKPAAVTFTARATKPAAPPIIGAEVVCGNYTEMAMALKAGKKVALKAPPKKPTFTQRAIDALTKSRAK